MLTPSANEAIEKCGLNSRKSVRGQRYPLPPCEFIRMCGGKSGSGLKGVDDLCLASLELQGWDLSLKAGIWASRLGVEPQGWEWASRLGFMSQRGWTDREGEIGEGRKISPVWKHRSSAPSGPLPKKGTNRPTNQPFISVWIKSASI